MLYTFYSVIPGPWSFNVWKNTRRLQCVTTAWCVFFFCFLQNLDLGDCGHGEGEQGVLTKLHVMVSQSLTSCPCNARTEHAGFSVASLRFTRVVLTKSHYLCVPDPALGFGVYLVANCCTFDRRDCTPSTVRGFGSSRTRKSKGAPYTVNKSQLV